MKPIIGITTNIETEKVDCHIGTDRIYSTDDYIKAVEKSGGIPILLPPVKDENDIKMQLNLCDGYIFSGGNDINPILYNENPHINLGYVDSGLDEYQICLLKEIIKLDKPILAICRGLQLLNVVQGGNLFQDLTCIKREVYKHNQYAMRYETTHKVNVKPNSILGDLIGNKVNVNSFHHQCINKLGENLEVIAWSDDEVIEAVSMLNKKFILGIQWHPEMLMVKEKSMMGIFKALIYNCSIN